MLLVIETFVNIHFVVSLFLFIVQQLMEKYVMLLTIWIWLLRKYGKIIGKVSVEPKYENACAISSAREERGLSQRQLSELSWITQCNISRI